jgi:hypothetical protein
MLRVILFKSICPILQTSYDDLGNIDLSSTERQIAFSIAAAFLAMAALSLLTLTPSAYNGRVHPQGSQPFGSGMTG